MSEDAYEIIKRMAGEIARLEKSLDEAEDRYIRLELRSQGDGEFLRALVEHCCTTDRDGVLSSHKLISLTNLIYRAEKYGLVKITNEGETNEVTARWV